MARLAKPVVAAALALGLILVLAPQAQAATYQSQVQFAGPFRTATVTDTLAGRLSFGSRFSQVDQVCFDFVFTGNLLDPGEELNLTVGTGRPIGSWGFANFGSSSQSTRTLCLSAEFQPDAMAAFLDGQDRVSINMWSGSVTIDSVAAVLNGA